MFKSYFSIALICATRQQIQASPSRNQGPETSDLIPLGGQVGGCQRQDCMQAHNVRITRHWHESSREGEEETNVIALKQNGPTRSGFARSVSLNLAPALSQAGAAWIRMWRVHPQTEEEGSGAP